MANGYEHDVFISYSRKKLWPEWIEKTFMPLFEHYLNLEIPGAKIFIDYEMETGNTWPANLANGLSQSKVLVGLWCKPYFVSDWCLTELSSMYAREQGCDFGTPTNTQRLIIPATLHDGEDFPEEAKLIQWKNLNDYSHVWLADGSKAKEELSKIICNWVPDIVKAIGAAPDYDSGWGTLAYDTFMETFRLANSDQTTVPSMGN